MQDLHQWLESVGLSEYVRAFQENAVDWRVLPSLTEEDLKELGLKLGHRRIFQQAVAALGAELPAEPDAHALPDKTSNKTLVEASVDDDAGAEHRQLTALFCDLVGSTALADRLDPETVRQINRAFQQAASAAIEAHRGYVARYMGDGVLAYFGYPVAHEDDAERAVRAALELARVVPELQAGVTLQVRVGVATGPVVVGDVVGDGAARERAAVGSALNLAARTQAEAAPNEVLIADATRALVAGLFECTDLGGRTLRGFEQTQRLWRVSGARETDSRFEALRSGVLTRLVGRESELGLLVTRWRSANEGEGQVVALCGEPGIGKSRLMSELRRATQSDPHIAVRYQCSPFLTHSAFHPFIEQLRRAARFDAEDDVEMRLDRLEGMLAGDVQTRAQALAPLAGLLSLVSPRLPEGDAAPAQRKAEVMTALRDQLEALCATRPVLLLFEDAHWADPTSIEVLDTLVDAAKGLRALLVVTFRPEFSPNWQRHGHVSELRLSRLTQRDGVAIVTEVAGGKSLPEEVVERILTHTDGVPLFVEELTKTVLGAGLLEERPDRYVLAGALPEIAIPSTLHGSLTARLDRLGDAKEVAQIGACIGRDFTFDLLRAVSPANEDTLREALARLVEQQIVLARGGNPDGPFTFKHALVQDAAYDGLLSSRREQIHAAIVSALEVGAGDDPGDAVALLAYHCRRAGLVEKAVRYGRIAGEKSNDRSAYQEALRFLEEARDLATSLPESEQGTREAIRNRLALRPALGAFGRYEELLCVLSETETLARSLDDGETETVASIHKTHVLSHRGRLDAAVAQGERSVALASRIGRRRLMVGANAVLGMAYHYRGDLQDALDAALPDAEDLRGRYRHERLETTATSSVNWLSNVAGMHALLGRFDEALAFADEAQTIASETGKPFDAVMAGQWYGMVLVTAGRPAEAIERLETVAELIESRELAFMQPWALVNLGHACTLLGDPQRGRTLLERSCATATDLGLVLARIWSTARLSHAAHEAGDADAARNHAEEALRDAQETGCRWLVVLGLRSLAQARASTGEAAAPDAGSLWRRAIEVAESCGAAPYLAETRLELAMHLAGSDRTAEPRKLAAAALGSFRELGMPFWVERGERALAAIRGRDGHHGP